MIRTPTVFVVGAGASRELEFPSGATLLEEIATALDIQFDHRDRRSGDTTIYAALRELARQSSQADANAHLHACWRIRDAAHLGLSIDNVINQLDEDPLVPVCGKIGIARRLLVAERQSILRSNPDDPSKIPLAEVRPTWLGRFAQLISQDLRTSELEEIFDNISIVSFNYDRSIRRFLPFALMSQFALSETAAQALTKKLKIYHPYGSLGALPWEAAYPNGVAYGEADGASLIKVASSLRTFTEQVEDSANLSEMREALGTAERLVFLGFGYHRQNMELLTSTVRPNAKRVYGTSLGLSKSDKETVVGQLNYFFREEYRYHSDAILMTATCVDFMDEHFRTFVS